MVGKTLAYKNRFVQKILQELTDRFDTYPDMQPLPFEDMVSRIPLVFRLNNAEYTKMYSALVIGAELMFPDESHELAYIFEQPQDYGVSEDFCIDYLTDEAEIISYAPMNPFTEIGEVPDGYLLPAWTRWDDILPDFIPDWLADLIEDAIGLFTGYEDNDVLSLIGSIPLLANWQEILTEGLPRFQVNVSGKGHLELHFLNVPFGGRALVTVDTEFDPIDIIEGIIEGGFRLIELERDYSSAPPELDIDNIEEIEFEDMGDHIVYVTMIPVVDGDFIPLKFGGGIRKVVWCPDEIPDEECPECEIETLLEDEEFFEDEYLPATFGDLYANSVANNTALETAYDGSVTSIDDILPTAAPDDKQKNALCYAILQSTRLYASAKVCIIQSRNFLQIAFDELAEVINNVYDGLVNAFGAIYTPNLYSCFVDSDTAIDALSNASAIEDVACFLYDYLDGLAMTQANWDDAIDSAAATLTGDAGDIACIMNNDNQLHTYINFLQCYGISLQRIIDNENLDCPCVSDTYKIFEWDFATQGMGFWKFGYAGGIVAGTFTGTRCQSTDLGTVRRVDLCWDDFDPTWRIRSIEVITERVNGIGGVGDADRWTLRPFPYDTSGETVMRGASALGNGTFTRCTFMNIAPLYWSGGKQLCIREQGTDSSGTITYIDRVRIAFYADHAPSGYLSNDGDLCS